MKFVTKEQYDNAIEIVKNAIESGQLQYGHYSEENKEVLTEVYFEGPNTQNLHPDYVSFISPELAIKNQLFILRQQLKTERENKTNVQKLVDVLENEEKQLVKLLPTSKE